MGVANTDVMAMVRIETKEAVERVKEIVEMHGIGAFYLDAPMLLSRGEPGVSGLLDVRKKLKRMIFVLDLWRHMSGPSCCAPQVLPLPYPMLRQLLIHPLFVNTIEHEDRAPLFATSPTLFTYSYLDYDLSPASFYQIFFHANPNNMITRDLLIFVRAPLAHGVPVSRSPPLH